MELHSVHFESDATDECEQNGSLRSFEIISGAQNRLPAEVLRAADITSNVYHRSEIRESFVAQESSGSEDCGTGSSDKGAIGKTVTGQRDSSSAAERAPHIRTSPGYSVGARNASCTEDTSRTAKERVVQTPIVNQATSYVNDDSRRHAKVSGVQECAATPGASHSRIQQPSAQASDVSRRGAVQDNLLSLRETAERPDTAVVGQRLPVACSLDLSTQSEVHAAAAASATDYNIAVDPSTPSVGKTQALRISSEFLQSGLSDASSTASNDDERSSLMNANRFQANMIVQLRNKIKEQDQIIAALTQSSDFTSTWSTVETDVQALQIQCDSYKEDFEEERRAKERALNEKKSLEQQVTLLLSELRAARDKIADLEKKLQENEQKQSMPAADDRPDREKVY